MSINRPQEAKKTRIIMLESPQLFYTPKEMKDEQDVIYLHFDSSSIMECQFNEEDEIISSMKITRVLYRKVHFKNAKFPWVYVMESGMKQFLEIYANEQIMQTAKEKKWI